MNSFVGASDSAREGLTRNPEGVPTFKNTIVVDEDALAPPPAASETLTGATSKEVDDSLGKPGSGITSSEMRHEGKKHRNKTGYGGAEQWGSKDPAGFKTEQERVQDFRTGSSESE